MVLILVAVFHRILASLLFSKYFMIASELITGSQGVHLIILDIYRNI